MGRDSVETLLGSLGCRVKLCEGMRLPKKTADWVWEHLHQGVKWVEEEETEGIQ